MEINNTKIDVIETSSFALDGGAMFGIVPKTLWSKVYHPGDDKNRIPMVTRVVLIQQGEHKILIDTGNGLKYDEKKRAIYDMDLSNSDFDFSLKKFGLTKNDITEVILTHLHFDHAGGATDFNNQEVVPTFPNAKYYIQKQHYDYALNPSEKDTASFMQYNYVPLLQSGQLQFLDGESEILPGLFPIITNGHTPAMQMIKFVIEGEKFLFAADFLPTAAHIPFPFIMAYDNQPLISLDEKKKYLPIIYEDNWTVIFEHDNFMQAAKISPDEKGKGFHVKEKITLTA
jgi:glyoxylase-like metal-dependent hydrolase (beta-lactamase superfamily II)